MNRLSMLGGAAALLATTGLAAAADLPRVQPMPQQAMAPVPAPAFTWTGAYVGAQAGYAWSRADNDLAGFGRFRTSPDGARVGAFAGYNYQIGPAVVGLEGDINWADGSSTSIADGTPTRTRLGWDGSVRGRVGYAFDRVLAYGTGGVAFGEEKITRGGFKDDSTRVGWTLGAGVEAAVTQNILARVEYRYTDYGKERFTLGPDTVRSDLSDHRVTAGIGYKF